MAVIAQWMCDRDNSMFNSKKEADAHDKMLELGENFAALMLEKMPDIDEKQAENFGIYLAKNRDAVLQAFKGNPDALAELISPNAENVTDIAEAS
ncbi:MAG: YebG family protein [Pseudomonadales bacterium]